MFVNRMLKDRTFWKSLFLLAIPIALQNLLTSSFALVDILMLGSLSENTISAVGMASQMFFLHNVFVFGICSGGSVFIAQYHGSGNKKGITKTYGIILISCMFISLSFFLLSFFAPTLCMMAFTSNSEVIEIGIRYLKIAAFSNFGVTITMAFSTVLRGTEQVRAPLFANIVSVVINVIFNYILIFGKYGFPQMGVAGAAVATTVASFANPVMIVVFSGFGSIIVKGLRDIKRLTVDSFKGFYSVALPVFINEVLWATGVFVYNSIYGHMSHNHFAGLTILRTVENIVFVFFVGLCSACAVLVGKYIGLKKYDDAKEYASRFLIITIAASLLLGGGVYLMRDLIMSLFNISADVKNIALSLLLVFSATLTLKNIPYLSIVGIFRAGGDTKKAMQYDISCLWLVGIPITFVTGILFKLDFVLVFALMILSEHIVKTVLCLRHFKRMKWIKPVS